MMALAVERYDTPVPFVLLLHHFYKTFFFFLFLPCLSSSPTPRSSLSHALVDPFHFHPHLHLYHGVHHHSFIPSVALPKIPSSTSCAKSRTEAILLSRSALFAVCARLGSSRARCYIPHPAYKSANLPPRPLLTCSLPAHSATSAVSARYVPLFIALVLPHPSPLPPLSPCLRQPLSRCHDRWFF